MSTFRELVTANPKGMKWSYMITMTGIGEIWTDGLASWSSWNADYTERPGCLGTRDFKFIFRSDPQKPLTTGADISITLLDDGTDEVFQMFAPGYLGETWGYLSGVAGTTGLQGITALPADPAETDIWLDASNNMVAGYYHLGSLETIEITSLAGPGAEIEAAQCERAKFNTLAREHRIADGTRGMRITSSPTTFKGRIVEVHIAPVDSISGLLITEESSPIWAGVVSNVKTDDGKILIELSPLSSLLESAWPTALPKGRLGSGMLSKYITEAGWAKGVDFSYVDPSSNGGIETRNLAPGYYNAAGTFTLVVGATGHYSLYFLIKVIQDTLLNFFVTTTIDPFDAGPGHPYANKLKLNLREISPEIYGLYCTFMPDFTTTGSDFVAVTQTYIRAFGSSEPGGGFMEGSFEPGLRFALTAGTEALVKRFYGMAFVAKEDTSIRIRSDSPVYRFEPAWNPRAGVSKGLIRIQDGEKYELVEFYGTVADGDDPRTITLTPCKRGVGGTEPQVWGESGIPSGAPGAAVIQLLYLSDNYNDMYNAGGVSAEYDYLAPDLVVNALLLSGEGDSNADLQVPNTPTYAEGLDRLFGYRMGLGIHKRYVDYEGITAAFRKAGCGPLRAFWVEESGKGKDALEEFMRYHGMFFVTRRFVRSGVNYFGLSVDCISQPVGTQYTDTVTDSDRVMGSKAPLDLNERLTINVVQFNPYYTGWGSSKPDGTQMTFYDEWSIEEYGAVKALELKPTILDWYVIESNGDVRRARDAQYALGLEAAYRWFSAFGNGNFVLHVECPAPTGWRYQNGDHVTVTLTGPRDPSTGLRNLTAIPARVYNMEQAHGSRAGARLELRCSYSNQCELAPSARVTTITSTTLTLDANYYTTSDMANPFNMEQRATDADWFDPTIHGDPIPIRVWTEGKYGSTMQTANCTARVGNVLTIDANLTAASVATNLTAGERTIISFGVWPTAGAYFVQKYAFIANNSAILGAGSTDSPAKEWT